MTKTYTVTATDSTGQTVWTVTGRAKSFRAAVVKAAVACHSVGKNCNDWRWHDASKAQSFSA